MDIAIHAPTLIGCLFVKDQIRLLRRLFALFHRRWHRDVSREGRLWGPFSKMSNRLQVSRSSPGSFAAHKPQRMQRQKCANSLPVLLILA
ncbi:MAG: hypothetical protein EBX66_03980 [Betaproteobacteria bacterium]|nr:hypothetical protein [Betaproteobacteria bacterium]